MRSNLKKMSNFLKNSGSLSHRDVQDALEHLETSTSWGTGEVLTPKDFDISEVKNLRVDDLPGDLSSWTEWGEGELEEMDEDELESEFMYFRGKRWAQRALEWVRKGTVPPIVIIEANDFHGVGDGRGRVGVALGMGWSQIPGVIMKEKRGLQTEKVRGMKKSSSSLLGAISDYLSDPEDEEFIMALAVASRGAIRELQKKNKWSSGDVKRLLGEEERFIQSHSLEQSEMRKYFRLPRSSRSGNTYPLDRKGRAAVFGRLLSMGRIDHPKWRYLKKKFPKLVTAGGFDWDSFGFDTSDSPEEDRSPEWESRRKFEKEVGSYASALPADRFLKTQSVVRLVGGKIHHIGPNKAWFVYVDKPVSEAQKIGRRVYRSLRGPRSLTASDPYLHKKPLWVGTNDGEATLIENPSPHTVDQGRGVNKKDLLIRRGKDIFGARGFSISGSRSRGYTMTLVPYLKKWRGVFGKTSVFAQTIDELEEKLEEALSMLGGVGNKAASLSHQRVAGRYLDQNLMKEFKYLMKSKGNIIRILKLRHGNPDSVDVIDNYLEKHGFLKRLKALGFQLGWSTGYPQRGVGEPGVSAIRHQFKNTMKYLEFLHSVRFQRVLVEAFQKGKKEGLEFFWDQQEGHYAT